MYTSLHDFIGNSQPQGLATVLPSHRLTIAIHAAPIPVNVRPEGAYSHITLFSIAEDARWNEVVYVVSTPSTEWQTMINLPCAFLA